MMTLPSIRDTTVWGSTADDARVFIYDCNMFIIQATGLRAMFD
jgi:hypothetical protein